LLERVEVKGAQRTSERLIRTFVPIERGETFDVADPELEAVRYRLLGTGWFDDVDLRLTRGHKPGWVVLVVEVEERQTLVFQQLAIGVGWSVEGLAEKSQGDDSRPGRKAEPYLGLGVAETNFLGTGRTIGGEVLAAPDQQGVALRFFDPVVRASRWSLRADAMFTRGREYFGGDNEVRVSVACSDVDPDEREDCEARPKVAVVDYYRLGLGVSTARDLGSFTRLSVGLHGDLVAVPPGKMPVAASEVRALGESDRRRTPIDFAVEPGRSVVTMLTIGLSYDKRDSSVLPSRGTFLTFRGDLSSRIGVSDYEFVRLQSSANRWFRLPWRHVVRLGAFAGSIFGRAPFFYKFFVSDLTDLQPSRILDLNLDHRPAPNLFGLLQCGRAFDSKCGTAIEQMRQEELAARIDVEYAWPFVRSGRGFIKGGDLFGLVGAYALSDPNDLRVAVPGYKGFGRAPVDLTLDIGVRLDTQAGVFRLGFAKLFWLPVR
jgi:outer membrane protein assembly factor BamA